jgi:hypothetical protein
MSDSMIDNGTVQTLTLVFPSGSIEVAYGSLDVLKDQLQNQIDSVVRRKALQVFFDMSHKDLVSAATEKGADLRLDTLVAEKLQTSKLQSAQMEKQI